MRNALAKLPTPARWGVLVAASVLATAACEVARLPAALLLGAMAGGILVEQAGAGLKVPKLPFNYAQALIGCLIGAMLTPAMAAGLAARWPLVLGVTATTVGAAGGLGWAFSRLGLLPGTTAVWGLLPGGASAMVALAEDFGADARLVAFMQYARVLVVAGLASVLARWWVPDAHAPMALGFFPPVAGVGLAQTAAIATAGVVLGRVTGKPALVILGAMAAAGTLTAAGLVTLALPPWLMAACYAALGWTIGLRFTPEVVARALRLLPQTLMAIFGLVLVSAGVGVALHLALGVDPLSAYLATSPGGADSVAIIAAATPVDVGFVMTLQVARVLAVMAFGPAMSRWLAGRISGS